MPSGSAWAWLSGYAGLNWAASAESFLRPVGRFSPRMPDVHYIPILHDVVLPFQSQCAAGAGVSLGAGVEQLVPADGFGADEVLFKIGMDGSCGLNCARVYRDGPGAAFVFADGEERHQA